MVGCTYVPRASVKCVGGSRSVRLEELQDVYMMSGDPRHVTREEDFTGKKKERWVRNVGELDLLNKRRRS